MSICKLELQKKNDEDFSKYFSGGFLKLKLRFAEKGKVKKNVGVVSYPVRWAPCCRTWLKFEGKFVIVKREKNEVRDFYLLGSYPLVGRHVVNKPKIA